MKIRNLRWWIIGVCFLSTTINYLDRQCLSVANKDIREEFHLDKEDFASIIICFRIAYAVMQAVSGKLIDRIGIRIGMACSIVWWSVAGMLHALAGGLWSLRAFRFLLGMGEAGNWPAATKVVSEWFPARERGLAVGIFDSGSFLGGMLAPPLVAWILIAFGWRAAFLFTGAIGFLWLILWLWIYRGPREHPCVTEAERDMIESERLREEGAGAAPIPWLRLLGYSAVWGVIMGRFLTDCVWWFYTDWLPAYLQDERGFSVGDVGKSVWIIFLAPDIGNLGSGWLSGRLVRRGWSVNAARKFLLVVGALVMMAGLPAGLTGSAGWCLALVAVATLGCAIVSTMLLTLPSDLFPSSSVASVSGLSGMGAGLGAILFTWATGIVSERLSFKPMFIAAGILPLVAVGFVFWLIPCIRKVPPPAEPPRPA